MFKTYRIIPIVFILFLFGLTFIPAPIVIAQILVRPSDDVVVKCRPATKTKEREVCQTQPITKTKSREVCQPQPKQEWNEQRQQMITTMQTVCAQQKYQVTEQQRVCTKQPYKVTDQECAQQMGKKERRRKQRRPVPTKNGLRPKP